MSAAAASSSRSIACCGWPNDTAILERAAALSPTRAEAVRRGLAAARATYEAGAPDRAVELVAVLGSTPLGLMERATIMRLQGQIAVSLGQPQQAIDLLLDAAAALTSLDHTMARETYLEALEATMYAGRFGPNGGVRAVAVEVTRRVPAAPDDLQLVDHLLEAMLTWAIDGVPHAVPAMRRALAGLSSETAAPVAAARWAWLAYHVVIATWDDDHWQATTERYLASVREFGALSLLPSALLGSASFALWSGDFALADTLLEDALSISTAIGLPPTATVVRAALTAWRGQRIETEALVERVARDGATNGEDETLILADYCTAVLSNGLGDYAAALAAARTSAYAQRLGLPELLLPELVEAAVRVGDLDEAHRALDHLVARTSASGTSWALGAEAYCRALLAEGDAAETHFRAAIHHLDACRIAPFRNRARLAFGEWLRRERRRVDAREQLRTAHESFTAMGAQAFARRAERELLATGGAVPRHQQRTSEELTPQELQVARLAAARTSNHEIASQLFISSSTVAYHLSKAFRKLDINSRQQLTTALAGGQDRSGSQALSVSDPG